MTGYTAAESQALIKRARDLYLSQNPFDPHKKAVPAVDGSGMPAGFMTFPDIGEMQILGCKLGMEYLAIAMTRMLLRTGSTRAYLWRSRRSWRGF